MPSYTIYISAFTIFEQDMAIYRELAQYLASIGQAVRIERVPSMDLRLFGVIPSAWDFNERGSYAVVVENESQVFSVLNGEDYVFWWDPRFGHLLLDPRCRVALKRQYYRRAYGIYPFTKIRPWTYFESSPRAMQARLPEWRSIPRVHTKLYFRGQQQYARRGPILQQLVRRGILDTPETRVSLDEYLHESCTYSVILSLPGMGDLCHRDIEAFGIGTPVLRPRLTNQAHDPLIPNYHYISVDVDAKRERIGVIADRIAARFAEVIDDPEYLRFVAANAMRWYDLNVRLPESMALTVRLLRLPGLTGC